MWRLPVCILSAMAVHGTATAFPLRADPPVTDMAVSVWKSPGQAIRALWYDARGELMIVAGPDVTRWAPDGGGAGKTAGRFNGDLTQVVPGAKSVGVLTRETFDFWKSSDAKPDRLRGMTNPGGHTRVATAVAGPRVVFWTPGGSAVLVADRLAKPVSVTLADAKPAGLALSPTGRMAAVASQTGSVQIANLKADGTLDKKVSKRFPRTPDTLLSFSPDGRLLAVTSGGRLVLLDVNTAQIYRAFERRFDDGDISTFAFSPDGTAVAVGTREPAPVVRAWHVATGKPLGEFTGHRGAVTAVAFDAGARRVAAGDATGRVIVWKLAPCPGPRKSMPFADAWQRLDSVYPALGHEAMSELLANESGPALRDAITNLDKEREQLRLEITKLDDDEFRVREAAKRSLAKTGYRGIELLRDPARKSLGAEGEERVRSLLAAFERDGLSKPEDDLYGDTLRLLRAMQAMETNLTSEAASSLAQLKKRFPNTRVALDAEAILTTPRATGQD